MIMSSSEIVPGVFRIRGKYVDDFGYLSSYIVVNNGVSAVIDPGTAGDPGEDIIKHIKQLGLNPKNDVTAIICTHGHPDHVGGAGLLRKKTGASIMIHESDAKLLKDPSLFIKERLRLDLAGRLAMKLEKGPLRVNYRAAEPDHIFHDKETIKIGDFELKVIHTGGHSAGHCVFYESKNKILFSGDEVNNFPNEPQKFYLDLSGDIADRGTALDKMTRMDIDYLLPAHDIPHLFGEVSLQIKEARNGVNHFQDTVLRLIKARGDSDIEQLVYDIEVSRSVPIPEALDALLPTTLEVTLNSLKKAGLVKEKDGIWYAV
ncbi:MAG: Hydroxyacylglutathione hydrolase [Candidatus Thorarchaeota archaeon]|nr:MAG: Hydroxyacylglutathione hydrolase [Candidatus Thorarchaeota archaeon]